MSGSRSLFGILLTRIARLFFASGQGVFLPVWPSGGGCHAHGSADQAPPRLRFRHLRERGSRGKDPLQSSSILFNPLQSSSILFNPLQSFSIAPPSIQHGSRPDPRFGSLSGSTDPDQDRPLQSFAILCNPLQSFSILFNRPSIDPAWIPPRFGSLSGSTDPDQDRPLQSFSIAPPSIQHGSRPDPRFGSLSGSADPDQDRRTGAVPVSGPDQDRLGEDVRGDPRAPILIRIVGGGRRAILFSIPIRIGSRPCRSPAMAGRGGILIRIDPAPSRTIPLQRNVSEIPILSSRIVPKKRKK